MIFMINIMSDGIGMEDIELLGGERHMRVDKGGCQRC